MFSGPEPLRFGAFCFRLARACFTRGVARRVAREACPQVLTLCGSGAIMLGVSPLRSHCSLLVRVLGQWGRFGFVLDPGPGPVSG